MKKRRRCRNIFLFLPFLLVQPAIALAQSDSLFDCFPLSIGNRWTYHFTRLQDMFILAEYWVSNDTGLVNQEVLAKMEYPDSTLWTFRQTRMFHHHEGSVARGYVDTTLSDSLTYVLVELMADRHRLYQQVPFYEGHWDKYYNPGYASVYPFWRDTWDSLYVYRFCPVDSALTARFERLGHLAAPQARTLTLKKDTGLDSLQTGATVTEDYQSSGFQLLNKVILDVEKIPGRNTPESVSLFQNYPNPFNPSTTIRYALPHRSHATLTVYNTLGQQVAMLVNGEVEAGYHEVQFSASNLASGVYFYQLLAGDFLATKRLLVLR